MQVVVAASVCSAMLMGGVPCDRLVHQAARSSPMSMHAANTLATDPLAAARHAALSADADEITATYLEINSWLISMGGVTMLLDPILEGPLDFGLPPSLYTASKRVLPPQGLVRKLPPIDAIVITQGLDDHAHSQTLAELSRSGCSAPIIAPPSARQTLEKYFPRSQLTLLKKGERATVRSATVRSATVRSATARSATARSAAPKSGTEAEGGEGGEGGDGGDGGDGGERGVELIATSGALVGPPWQARENGYVIRTYSKACNRRTRERIARERSLYVEPHVEFDPSELARYAPIDACISPISGQSLPGLELVHGVADVLRLVRVLRPRWLLPMANGEIDASGVTAALVRPVGSEAEFERGLRRLTAQGAVDTQLVQLEPARPVRLSEEASMSR